MSRQHVTQKIVADNAIKLYRMEYGGGPCRCLSRPPGYASSPAWRISGSTLSPKYCFSS